MTRGIIALMDEYENRIPALVCTESYFKDQELMIQLARLAENRPEQLQVATEDISDVIVEKFDALKEIISDLIAPMRNMISINTLLKNKLIRLKTDVMQVEGNKTITINATPFFKHGNGEIVKDTKEYISELNTTNKVLIGLMKAQEKLTRDTVKSNLILDGAEGTGKMLQGAAKEFVKVTNANKSGDNYASITYLGMFKLEAYIPNVAPDNKETADTKFEIVKDHARSNREGGMVKLTLDKKQALEIINRTLECVTMLVEINGFIVRWMDDIIRNAKWSNYISAPMTIPLYLFWDGFRIYHNLLIESTRNSAKIFILAKQNGENVVNLAKRFIKA